MPDEKPKKEKTVAFQLRFAPSLLAELEEIASGEGRSVAGLVRWLAERHVRSYRLQQIREPEDFSDLLKPKPAPTPED